MNRSILDRQYAQVRYGILSARRVYEPGRLTNQQIHFLTTFGESKSGLLDGSLENRAYMGEALRYVWRKDRAPRG